jgi:hypothetical protein
VIEVNFDDIVDAARVLSKNDDRARQILDFIERAAPVDLDSVREELGLA